MDVRLVSPRRDLADMSRTGGWRGRVPVDDRGRGPSAERVGGNKPEVLLVGERVVPKLLTLEGQLVQLGVPGLFVPFVGPLEDEPAGQAEVVDLAQHLRVRLHGVPLGMVTL